MTDPRFDRMRRLHEQIRTARDELVRLQRDMADGPFPDAVLKGLDGEVRISELFGEHDDLILSFNMGTFCAYCTLWADEANGVLDHLQRRAAFVVVSPDDPQTQQTFAKSRGWRFVMLSHGESTLAVDEGFAQHDGEGFTNLMPGLVTVRREGEGLRRTGRTFYGPGDSFCSVYHFFDMLEGGHGGWEPRI